MAMRKFPMYRENVFIPFICEEKKWKTFCMVLRTIKGLLATRTIAHTKSFEFLCKKIIGEAL